jgi:hypothetical protein
MAQSRSELNALPQFLTNIDGLDIHFIHVRSRDANALPLIMTHGWGGQALQRPGHHRARDHHGQRF